MSSARSVLRHAGRDGALIGAVALATFTAAACSVVLAPAGWPPRLVARLTLTEPVASGPWGAGWDAIAGPAGDVQREALAGLVGAVSQLGAGALIIAAFALVLHTMGRLLAQWHGLTVRCALGAGLRDLTRMVCGELLRLVAVGTGCGAVAAALLLAALRQRWPTALTEPALPLPAALAVVTAALLALLIVFATAMPMLIALQRRVRAVSDLHGEHATARGPLLFAQNALVVLQLTGLLVVTYGGGLIVKSSALFDPDRPVPYSDSSVTARLRFSGDTLSSVEARAAAYQAVLNAARNGDTPLVAVTSPGVWLGFGKRSEVGAFCYCSRLGMMQPFVGATVRAAAVSPQALALFSIEVIEGREFTPADTAGAPRGIVLSDVAAARLFGGSRGIVGRTVLLSLLPGNAYTVIGIARAPAPPGLGAGGRPLPMAYFSILQHPPEQAELTARSGARARLEASGWPGALRGQRFALEKGRPLAALLRDSEAPIAWFGVLVLGVTAGAMALALAGLAALMNQAVTLRRREIAIRLALGAQHYHIVRWIGARALATTLIGVVLGVAFALQVRELLRLHVRGTTTADMVLLLQLVAVFGGLALLAGLVPARRALQVEPAAAWSGNDSKTAVERQR